MKTIRVVSCLFLISVLIMACSSSEEATNSNESDSQPEIYVFDDVPEPADTAQPEVKEPTTVDTKYFVHVGAFTTQGRADQFVKKFSSKTKYNLDISYSDEVRLFVVRIPAFTSKAEAEKVRNEFWQSGLFNDAFIVTQ